MISKSPYEDVFEYSIDIDKENLRIDNFLNSKGKKTVVVQGLGFVGSAMAAALSNAKDESNNIIYNVIGVDFPNEKNYWKIARVNSGKPPILSSDRNMDVAYQSIYKNKNLFATYSEHAYSKADFVVVAVHLDIRKKIAGNPYAYSFSYDDFKGAIQAVANNISENTLVVVETTVPPGTTEKVIYPIFVEAFKRRKLDISRLQLVHSSERIMPGPNYLNSVINFYRVYSGINKESKIKAKEFFESFINTEDYPLYEMHSTTASEMAKVLENSFRAMNIAFIQEWADYAQKAGVNLFEVIDAIRMRPTHKNIMAPGFGVGGYCLPKDSLLADWSYNNLFDGRGQLKMSLDAIATNDLMPEYTFKLLKQEIGDFKNICIAILGVSYLNDVADTRYSPTAFFYDKCLKEKAIIDLHDPIVTFWEERNIRINTDINHLRNKRHDLAVFAVRHTKYLNLTVDDILSILHGVRVIIDANNIITDDNARKLSKKGVKMIGVGKGHWENL